MYGTGCCACSIIVVSLPCTFSAELSTNVQVCDANEVEYSGESLVN